MKRKHPNVIFIITDDQGYGDLGHHSNPTLKTPNLDAMAARSVSLDNHHHDPLCSPSRAALMTGRYATRTGVWHVIQGRQLLNKNETTMADIFAANGYRTAMFGKWHLGDTYPYAPQYRGFAEVVKHNGGGVGEIPDYWGNNYIDDTYFHNGEPEAYAGYCTDVFFNEAIRFTKENQDQPFFIYLATNAMHSPFIVPEEYATPYLEQGIPERRAHFYGMIANFDENMGRLFDCLADLGLGENTVVIFTSDHGTAAGYDPQTNDGYNAGMRGKKGSVYDGGHRVSFFMQWQGVLPEGHTVEPITGHIDVLPTLIDLCQLDTPTDLLLDGMSLRSLLNTNECDSGNEWPERTLFVHLQPDQPEKWHHCVVLSDRWRLINGTELYDMALDFGQTSDCAEQYPDIVTQLRQAYEIWWDDISPAFA
ncbi:MAG: arylsulfatase [Chloroflexota bacterium]